MKLDGFMLAMLGAVALAVIWPRVGAVGGSLPMALITQIGIAVVFFLHGANLSGQALRSGATNWRLHLFVQCCTFVFFPIVGIVVFVTTRGFLPPELRLGFFFLCAICSTVSSSVALVAVARGNVSAAIFNATLSGLIGMVLTPVLLGLVDQASAGHFSVLGSIADIGLKLLLPFALGQALRPVIGPMLGGHKAVVTTLDRFVIVLIVYSSFCDATAGGLWSRYDLDMLLVVAIMVAGLLVSVLTATTLLSRRLRFSSQDEITAVFCGSKKSLANGAPIAKIIFGSSSSLGMILLPLMLYHQFQLIVCSALARRYSDRALEADNKTPGGYRAEPLV